MVTEYGISIVTSKFKYMVFSSCSNLKLSWLLWWQIYNDVSFFMWQSCFVCSFFMQQSCLGSCGGRCFFLYAAILSWLLWWQIYNDASPFTQQCCLGCYGSKYTMTFFPSCSKCCLGCYGRKYIMFPPWWSYAVLVAIVVSIYIYIYNHVLPSSSKVVLVAMVASIWIFFHQAAKLSWLL